MLSQGYDFRGRLDLPVRVCEDVCSLLNRKQRKVGIFGVKGFGDITT